jgi:hypothetical protein
MLDAQSLPTLPTDFEMEPAVSPETSEPSMERGLTDLLTAARRVLANVRPGTLQDPKLQADLREARDLFVKLGVILESSSSEDELLLPDDATWFQIGVQRVDMGRRGAVRRILRAMADRRVARPGETLSVNDLFEIGWPGENIPYESQVRRVYTAIWTLRTLGLDAFLLTRNEGYMLDPKKALRRS